MQQMILQSFFQYTQDLSAIPFHFSPSKRHRSRGDESERCLLLLFVFVSEYVSMQDPMGSVRLKKMLMRWCTHHWR